MYGYIDCAPKAMDVQANVNLQYCKKSGSLCTWTTLQPGGFDHKVTTALNVSAERSCSRGRAFTHYRTYMTSKVGGVEATSIWSEDVQFYCTPV